MFHKSSSKYYFLIIAGVVSAFLLTPSCSLCPSFPNTGASTERNLFSSTKLDQFSTSESTKHLLFPGGGIYFYWQAGAITYLREKDYPIQSQNIRFTGASAGALCATLTACDVNFEEATSLALNLARSAGVWDRPLGLYGIWGGMIDEWLDHLLPVDNDDLILNLIESNKLSLLLTELPSFETRAITKFESRCDLIAANLASVHIPMFLDGTLTNQFRSKHYIDGSFVVDYKKIMNDSYVSLEWKNDPNLKDRNLADALSAISEQHIWDLLEMGRKGAMDMEKKGNFDVLLH